MTLRSSRLDSTGIDRLGQLRSKYIPRLARYTIYPSEYSEDVEATSNSSCGILPWYVVVLRLSTIVVQPDDHLPELVVPSSWRMLH